MNKQTVSIIGVIVVLVSFAFGWLLKPVPPVDLSGTINYSNSLSQINLYNTLESLLQDITVVRRSVAGVVSSTVTLNWLSVSSTTPQTTTTAVTGAIPGDVVLVVASTTAEDGIQVLGKVITAGSVQLTAINASTSQIVGVDPAAVIYNIKVIPMSTFVAPAALTTVSSTSN